MEYKVNDFLNEIDEIAPPPPNAVQEEVWKQCFDELTGYAYYWNKNTDEVTWNQPKSYEKNSKTTVQKKIPSFPQRPTTKNVSKESIKIYSVGETSKQIPKKTTNSEKKNTKRKYPKENDSEDEKIVLISSYGTDSESEEEPPDTKKPKSEKTLSVDSDKCNSEEDDDLDILAKIQKRAQELKELGGDVPVEVKKVVETSKKVLLNDSKITSGTSLVAGYYSDSEEEIVPPEPEPVQVSHSTLFPVTKPINVRDFTPTKTETSLVTSVNNEENFDAKLFKRKKKIAVPVVNVIKKENPGSELRKGLGFDKEVAPTDKTSDNSMYLGFKKGGVAFVKSDVLNPPLEEQNWTKKPQEDDKTVNKEEIDNMYSTLKDKLLFLNEGRPALSSVQSMVVQAETLMVAMNDGALKGSYIKKWLMDTCSELKKLEKDATPAGWVLQWDKIHRRYFYQNKQTGSSQWEYPQPDTNTNDVAMDISTTPPPILPIEQEEMSPPLPPAIRSPSPPPPPIISAEKSEIPLLVYDVPLPADTIAFAQQKVELNGQPLPPGVDITDVATPVQQPTAPQVRDSLNSALDSFYSDIAAISSPLPAPPVEESTTATTETVAVLPVSIEIAAETAKKKKKVKLVSNLGMKKKGVSQLVEKWRNVQQEYKN